MIKVRLVANRVVLAVGLIALGACGGGGGGNGGGGAGGDGGGNGTGAAGGHGTGTGKACQKADDCDPIVCACGDGSSTGYNACDNGFCATECPSNQHGAGEDCVVPGGCFCASGACEFSTTTCCATKGNGASGDPCASDCDCTSGMCSFQQCF